MPRPIVISTAGLVTSVGLSAPASCAAIRGALTNHTETGFRSEDGEVILGAQVPLDEPWRGRARLSRMLSLAITECLGASEPNDTTHIPLLLCVAEKDRPGRLADLDDALLEDIRQELGFAFHPELSGTVPHGRVGTFLALERARDLLDSAGVSRVVIAAADSLLTSATLGAFGEQNRLLTAQNSDGFIPGEAAGAIVVTSHSSGQPRLVCLGLGTGRESSTIGSDEPLRADGLTTAIKAALQDAACSMDDLHFRITDASGEQYYFKEAALAATRTLRRRIPEFDLWHPADCVGETGAAIGPIILAVALAASRKHYAPGAGILLHAGSDAGRRVAVVLRNEA